VQTMDSTTARPEPRTRRRRRLVAACIAVALLAGLGVMLWLDRRAPSPDADAGRLAHYMAGPAFAALPDDRKVPYLDAFRRAKGRGELTPEQLRGVLSNVEMGGEKDPLQRYFSLPPLERQKFLDDVIDRTAKAEKASPPREKEAPPEMPADNRHLDDATPPGDRARLGQFLQDLHNRRSARGLPDDGRFLFARPE
jgi:hypothetical protein